MIWQLGDKNKKLSARAYFLDITPNFTHYLTKKCIYSKRMKNQFLCLSERVNLCGIHRSNNSMKRNSVIIVEALHFYCCEKKSIFNWVLQAIEDCCGFVHFTQTETDPENLH